MRNAIAWPFDQPGRAMTSFTSAERSGVRWSGPRSSTVAHTAGDQVTDAVVTGRAERLFAVPVKITAWSAAWARSVSAVASLCVSSAVNWIFALAIIAPGGTARF